MGVAITGSVPPILEQGAPPDCTAHAPGMTVLDTALRI